MTDPAAPSRVQRAVGLLRACHFQPTLAVTAFTTALAAFAGRGALGCVGVAAAVLAGQCSTGWSNDWLDAERDRSVNRVDKPIVAGLVSVATVRACAISALILTVPLSLLSGWRATLVHLVAIAAAWSYNAGLKATIISPLPYGISFALLPAFVTLGLPLHPWPRPGIMIVTALLGIGAHFINTLADRSDDEHTGIRGLPQRLPATITLVVGVTCLALSACVIRLLSDRLRILEDLVLAVSLGCDAAVIIAICIKRPRAAWTWTLIATGSCVALFAVTRPSLVA